MHRMWSFVHSLEPAPPLSGMPVAEHVRLRCAEAAEVGHMSGVSSRCRVTARERNGNWKGGRARHKAGYVMIRVPDHPRAGRAGYVFEHILVMEDVVGRHLVDGENVHHRNGVKDDNRPENLELWLRPHPPGIRASDALAWAATIISRYGGESPATSNSAQGGP